jgi:hypothetical protein
MWNRNLLVAALTCSMAAACASATGVSPPSGEPYVRGPVESITHHATASNLLVRAGPGSREMCGISATVDRRTSYLERSREGVLRRAAMSAVEPGDTVEVYVSGPVAESCPVQGYASAIIRLTQP